MVQVVPCTKSDMSCKFHVNRLARFFRNVANKQTNNKQTYNDENITVAVRWR